MNLRKKVLGIMLAFVLAVTGFGLVGCGGGTENQVIDNGDQEQEQEQQETTYNYEFTTKYSIDGADWKYLETATGAQKVGYNTFGVNNETNTSNVVNPLEDLVFADVADVTDADQLVVEFKITNNSENDLYYLINIIHSSLSIETDAETGDSSVICGELIPQNALYYVGTEEKDVQDLNEMYDDEDWGWRYEQDNEENWQLVSDGLFELRDNWESLDSECIGELIHQARFVCPTSANSCDYLTIAPKTTIEDYIVEWFDSELEIASPFVVAAGQSKYFYMMINADEQDEEVLSELLDILTEDGFSGLFKVSLSEDDNISFCTVIDGIVYADDGNGGYIAWGLADNTITTLTLIQGTTGIVEYAFSGCDSITNIVFPNSLINIGNDAFSECSGLTSVTIPEGVYVGYNAFWNCDALQTVIILADAQVDYSFADCDSLSKVFVSGSTQIQYMLCYNCPDTLAIYTDAESKPANWSNYWNRRYNPNQDYNNIVWNTSLEDFMLFLISE